ncbi:MAG: glycosyltransferase [Chloroflexi bacterium]|nr:glycosyltransferase [Chloroflexota bacterium]
MRVLYLSRVRLNPYVRLLARGVEQADADIHTAIVPRLSWRAALRYRPHIIHVHWAELQYSYGYPSRPRAALALRSFLLNLTWMRRLGARLVYTVHNLSQHEGFHPDLNDAANRWLFEHADAIHVHDESSAATVARIYGREQGVYIAAHGNYLGVYPNGISRETARARLGLASDHFVYLCLGQVRPYKGLDQLIEAFVNVDDPRCDLVIAGHVAFPELRHRIESLTAEHPNIKLFPSYIADEELQVFFNAADACVLPYRRATTSGAALLALSFGKPVVAPELGPFPALISPDIGVLYHPDDGDLAEALKAVQALDREKAREAALAFAARCDWSAIGAIHARVYRDLLDRTNGG